MLPGTAPKHLVSATEPRLAAHPAPHVHRHSCPWTLLLELYAPPRPGDTTQSALTQRPKPTQPTLAANPRPQHNVNADHHPAARTAFFAAACARRFSSFRLRRASRSYARTQSHQQQPREPPSNPPNVRQATLTRAFAESARRPCSIMYA